MSRFLPPAPLRQECGCRLEGDNSHVGLCVSLGRKFREDIPVSEQASEDHCTWHQFANASMYSVLDGHGGMQCSRVAATLLEESIRQLSDAGNITPESLGTAFGSVDSRWAAQCDDSGTTVTLAILQHRNVTIAHVGDSVAVLVKKDGSTEMLTTPHLASNANEQQLVCSRGGTITAPGGPGESYRVDGLIEVTRAIGDVWIKDKISCEPDVCSFELKPEHKLLILATDGLWDTVNATQASSVALTEIKKGSTPVEVAQALAKRAYVSGSVDDIGVLVILLDTPDTSAAATLSSATLVESANSSSAVAAGATCRGASCSPKVADASSNVAGGTTNGAVSDAAAADSSGTSCEHRHSDGGAAVPAARKCADKGGHYTGLLGHLSPGYALPAMRRPGQGRAAGPLSWGFAALATAAGLAAVHASRRSR